MSYKNFKQNTGQSLSQHHKGQIIITLVLAVLFIVLHFASDSRLLSPANIKLLVIQSVFPAFISWGMMFIFTTGIIDLSVGANCILSANIGVLFGEYLGFGYPGLIIMTIVSAVIFEQITVRCAVTLKIPSWIAGLGMALILESATTVGLSAFLKGTNILRLEKYRALGLLPVMLLFLVIGFAVSFIIINRTSLGCNIRAVGASPHVAEAMGINARKTIILGAVVGAVFIGIGTLCQVSYTGKFIAISGLGSLSTIFKPLAVVLLSGSFTKYISMPVGILMGSVVVTSVFNVLTLLGVPSGTWQEILLGAIIIVCGMVSGFGNKEVVK